MHLGGLLSSVKKSQAFQGIRECSPSPDVVSRFCFKDWMHQDVSTHDPEARRKKLSTVASCGQEPRGAIASSGACPKACQAGGGRASGSKGVEERGYREGLGVDGREGARPSMAKERRGGAFSLALLLLRFSIAFPDATQWPLPAQLGGTVRSYHPLGAPGGVQRVWQEHKGRVGHLRAPLSLLDGAESRGDGALYEWRPPSEGGGDIGPAHPIQPLPHDLLAGFAEGRREGETTDREAERTASAEGEHGGLR